MANRLEAYEARHRLAVDENSVTIAGLVREVGSPPVRVSLFNNGAALGETEMLSGGSFSYVVPLGVGLNEIVVTATDSAGGTVQAFVPVIRLITDRTYNDRLALEELLKRPVSEWTEQERTAFYKGLYKGGYSRADLNRVVLAAQYLSLALNDAGYFVVQKADGKWTDENWLSPMDAETYLADAEAIRNALPLPSDAPKVPQTMEKLGLNEVNSIERILVLTDRVLSQIQVSNWYAGEIFSGEV